MNEDRTAEAALAIERYVRGLRSELSLLGAAEADDMLGDVRAMLVDAAHADPERAFAEMDRLGEPSELAATLLAERGIAPTGGIPTASWWRLGTAAVIDIFVGIALPVAVAVALYDSLWSAFAANDGVAPRLLTLVLVAGVLALASVLSWRYWSPWRTPGRAATPGMRLAGIAFVRIGGSRAVVGTTELKAAGIRPPTRTLFSAGVAVGFAVLALAAAVWMVSAGALDPAGAGLVTRFAGSPEIQRDGVSTAVLQLYQAAVRTSSEMRTWPTVAEPGPDAAKLEAALTARYGSKSRVSGQPFQIDGMSNPQLGVWTVAVTELPEMASPRHITLTYTLRVDWAPEGGRTVSWVLSQYDPAP